MHIKSYIIFGTFIYAFSQATWSALATPALAVKYWTCTAVVSQYGSQFLLHCGSRWLHAMQKETNGEKYSQPLIVGMPLLLLISYIPRSAGIKVNGSLQNNMLDEMICCIINVLAVITSYKHIHLHVIQSLLTIYKHGRPQGTHKIRLPLHVYHLQLHILMKKKNNIYQHNLHAVSISTNWWDTFHTIIILD